jgi:predicted nuclease with TOPRIM domain
LKDEENVVDGSILAEGAADEASVSHALDYSPQLGDTDQIPVLASF